MNIVMLAVSPMTRKMLLSIYGAEPIQIPNKSAAHDLLHIIPQSDINKEASATLTTFVQVYVNKELETRLQTNAGRVVGMALHRYYIRKQNEFVEWSVSTGCEAKSSLTHFREVHNIDEDDYSEESAYRSWTRFKAELKKNNSILVKNSPSIVRPKINPILAPFVASKAIKVVSNHFNISEEDLLKSTRHNTPKKILAYIMRRHGNMKLAEIGAMMRQHNLTRISLAVTAIEKQKQKNLTLKQDVESCINLL